MGFLCINILIFHESDGRHWIVSYVLLLQIELVGIFVCKSCIDICFHFPLVPPDVGLMCHMIGFY